MKVRNTIYLSLIKNNQKSSPFIFIIVQVTFQSVHIASLFFLRNPVLSGGFSLFLYVLLW